MAQISSALPVRSLVLTALIAVTFSAAPRSQLADTTTIPDRAAADRADTAPTVLAGCFVINGVLRCY